MTTSAKSCVHGGSKCTYLLRSRQAATATTTTARSAPNCSFPASVGSQAGADLFEKRGFRVDAALSMYRTASHAASMAFQHPGSERSVAGKGAVSARPRRDRRDALLLRR